MSTTDNNGNNNNEEEKEVVPTSKMCGSVQQQQEVLGAGDDGGDTRTTTDANPADTAAADDTTTTADAATIIAVANRCEDTTTTTTTTTVGNNHNHTTTNGGCDGGGANTNNSTTATTRSSSTSATTTTATTRTTTNNTRTSSATTTTTTATNNNGNTTTNTTTATPNNNNTTNHPTTTTMSTNTFAVATNNTNTNSNTDSSMIRSISKLDSEKLVAGQAILDLSSCVKELLENAFDSGGTTINIRLFNKGLDIVEVSDDGCGIPIESRPYLALPHTTSKIRNFNDICYSQSQNTTMTTIMGFRGEALYSLACTSGKLVVATRTQTDEIGQKMEFNAQGKLLSTTPMSKKIGTNVACVQLFAKLPVRRHDLISRITYYRQKVIDLVSEYAIFHSTTRIHLMDVINTREKTILRTTPNNTNLRLPNTNYHDLLASTISSIWGTKTLSTLVPITIDLKPHIFNDTDTDDVAHGSGAEAAQSVAHSANNTKDGTTTGMDATRSATTTWTTTTDDAPSAGAESISSSLSSSSWKIMGFVSSSSTGKNATSSSNNKKKSQQYFAIQKRPVEMPKKLSRVLKDVYRRFSTNSNQPSCCLELFVPKWEYDINLSPDKRLVVLQHETEICLAFEHALQTLWSSESSGGGDANDGKGTAVSSNNSSQVFTAASSSSSSQTIIGTTTTHQNNVQDDDDDDGAEHEEQQQQQSGGGHSSNNNNSSSNKFSRRYAFVHEPTLSETKQQEYEGHNGQCRFLRDYNNNNNDNKRQRLLESSQPEDGSSIRKNGPPAANDDDDHHQSTATTAAIETTTATTTMSAEEHNVPTTDEKSELSSSLSRSAATRQRLRPNRISDASGGGSRKNYYASSGMCGDRGEEVSPNHAISSAAAAAASNNDDDSDPGERQKNILRVETDSERTSQTSSTTATTITPRSSSNHSAAVCDADAAAATNNPNSFGNVEADHGDDDDDDEDDDKDDGDVTKKPTWEERQQWRQVQAKFNNNRPGSVLNTEEDDVAVEQQHLSRQSKHSSSGDISNQEARTKKRVFGLERFGFRVVSNDESNTKRSAVVASSTVPSSRSLQHANHHHRASAAAAASLSKSRSAAPISNERRPPGPEGTLPASDHDTSLRASPTTTPTTSKNESATATTIPVRTPSTRWASFSGTNEVIKAALQDRNAMRKRKRKHMGMGSSSSPSNPSTKDRDVVSGGDVDNVRLSKDALQSMSIIGQFNMGFILARSPDGHLWIVDQHASDEACNFERLCRETVIHEQKLITPLPLELSVSEEHCVLDHMEIFEKNGFRFVYDESKPPRQRLALTALPHSGAQDGRKAVQYGKDDVSALCAILRSDDTDDEDSDDGGGRNTINGGTGTDGTGTYGNNAVRRYASTGRFGGGGGGENAEKIIARLPKSIAMFASRACRGSIMIGKALSEKEMDKIIRRLGEISNPWNCAHGRPTMQHVADLQQILKQDDRRAAEHVAHATVTVLSQEEGEDYDSE